MSPVADVPWESFRGVVVVAVALLSVLVVSRLSPEERGLGGLRSRLLLRVPWGTLITVAFVTSVYLFVQDGLTDPRRPLVIPFRSWSYFYPLGMVTAAFAHSSWSHLLGNLIGTIAYATVAEYAWGHYPRKRGVQTFSSWWTNPYARILAVPAVSVVVGLFSALFALGPVVGFSGVVFAYAGFALVQRPILAGLAILGSRILSLGIAALSNPRTVTSPRPRVVTPWWTNVAIQGHAIGLLAGVLLGLALARSRDEWPGPRRLWFVVLAFAAFQGLWAVYVPASGGRFVLFRWLGVSLVFVLAALIVAGAAGDWNPTLPALGVSRRTVAVYVLAVALASLSGAAVFYNVAPLDDQPTPEPSIEVGDYQIAYAEDIEDGYVGAVSIPVVDYSPSINTSGVIVTSERRYVWRTMVEPVGLKQRGRASFLVGGLGWRERVFANRTGWSPTGGEDVYKVYLRPAGERRTLAFSSPPGSAEPVVAGRNVSIRPTEERFEFVVSRNGTHLGNATVPSSGNVSTAGGITFRRNDSAVYAIENRTRVQIARRSGD